MGQTMVDVFCAGCDVPGDLDEMGLCDRCAAKLERDLIRNRDWDYSVTAFAVPEDRLEWLRKQIIRNYGAAYELITRPDVDVKRKCKTTRISSPDQRLMTNYLPYLRTLKHPSRNNREA